MPSLSTVHYGHQIGEESVARTIADVHAGDRRRLRQQWRQRTGISFDETVAHEVAKKILRVRFTDRVRDVMLAAQLDGRREARLRNGCVGKAFCEPRPQRAIDAGERERLGMRIAVRCSAASMSQCRSSTMSASTESFITSTRIVCSSLTVRIASSAASADLRIMSTLAVASRPRLVPICSATAPERSGQLRLKLSRDR